MYSEFFKFPGQGGYLLIQIVFFVLVVIGTIRRGKSFLQARFQVTSAFAWQLFLGLASLLVLCFTLYFLLLTYRISPHGDYDAQAIWDREKRAHGRHDVIAPDDEPFALGERDGRRGGLIAL